MVTLLLDSAQLEVVLSRAERTMAFRKGNVIVPRSTIAKVQLTDDAWNWLRGVPGPGSHVPGLIAMGTWTSAGDVADFAIIRRRRPAVVIDLTGHPEFQRVVLTTRHGRELVQALRVGEVSTATDVVEIVAETGTIPTQNPPASRRPRVSRKKPGSDPS